MYYSCICFLFSSWWLDLFECAWYHKDGIAIPWDKVCDGTEDCPRFGIDESFLACAAKNGEQIFILLIILYLGSNRLFDWSRDMVLQIIYHCTTDMVLATVIYQLKT